MRCAFPPYVFTPLWLADDAGESAESAQQFARATRADRHVHGTHQRQLVVEP
jgi:hypothetical protein